MKIKVLVLGRPGSGKSTAARSIMRAFEQQGTSVRHINDYDILQRMFLDDIEHSKFRPTPNNGFDAIDLGVLDIALHEVERKTKETNAQLVTIEFARSDYREALQQFSPAFLKDTHILFLDVDLNTCLYRVHERVKHAGCADDHPSFSDNVFRDYYGKDNRLYMFHSVQREFALRRAVHIIENTGSLTNFLERVEDFARRVFVKESNGQMLIEKEEMCSAVGTGSD